MSAAFTASGAELRIITAIAVRAVRLRASRGVDCDFLSTSMDIEAVHCNGCPLDLNALLVADDFNFAHDVFGIERHIDRNNGRLRDFFLPRFAANQRRGKASTGSQAEMDLGGAS